MGTIGLGSASDRERFSGWLGLLKVLARLLAAGSAQAVPEAGDELGACRDT
jgi:hypothetical protein